MMAWIERRDGLLFTVATLFLLLLSTAGRGPGLASSIALLTVGVVLFGLPHGALDPLIARRLLGTNRNAGLLLFLLAYASVAAIYGVVWWQFPALGLATFLCISAFHFSTDWEQRGHLLTRCAYGLAIVTLPVVRHAAEVQQIYNVLSPAGSDRVFLLSRMVALPAAAVALVGALTHWRIRRRDLLDLVCIVAGALLLHPLLYFSCYFCCLHSPRHLFATAREQGLASLGSIAKAAAPATLTPVLMAVVFFARAAPSTLDDRLLQIVFVGLAVLTVPHMILHALAHRSHQPLRLSPAKT